MRNCSQTDISWHLHLTVPSNVLKIYAMGSYRVPRKRNIEKQALSTWYLHLTVLSKSASTSTSVEGMLEIEEQRNHEDKIKKARKEKRSERILEVDEKNKYSDIMIKKSGELTFILELLVTRDLGFIQDHIYKTPLYKEFLNADETAQCRVPRKRRIEEQI
ncbi:11713_t:CDS:2 [Funneliformis geosporum]|uniref:11713_t:CDS:1 n=1 Tax=Funneliformis geosporum TaxID=1117311 RepID=A0A9W4SE16_9GLOM|nr:11713_t:CDS:2 [Funneliformis geosporum]